jgi:hypothetical protein
MPPFMQIFEQQYHIYSSSDRIQVSTECFCILSDRTHYSTIKVTVLPDIGFNVESYKIKLVLYEGVLIKAAISVTKEFPRAASTLTIGFQKRLVEKVFN